jgi:hypothetical protein
VSTQILSEVEQFRTLEQALQWAFVQEPRGELIDVVAQDEYTHDVIIRMTPEVFLVFDTT